MSVSELHSKNFFIIAGGALQCEFIKRVKERGYITHVFDNDSDCPGKAFADYFYHIDITDKEYIYEIAQQLNPVAVQAVVTEIGNITACWVGEKLGLRNNSYEIALDTTDKSRMKEIFYKNGIPTAKSLVLTAEMSADHIKFNYPFLVKSSDSSASRGLSFVQNENELTKALELARKNSHNGLIIVEEFIEGTEFAVETISFNGKHFIVGVTELGVEIPPYIMLSYRIMPARISNELKEQIEAFTFKVLNAFNIQHGACHVELFHNKNGFFMVEIASRLGGWRDKMMMASIGVNYLDLIIDDAVNIPVEIRHLYNKYCLVRSILNEKDYERYLFLKENYPNNFLEEKINFPYRVFQAKNLIEAQGYYCLQTDTRELLDIFVQRYNN